MVSSRVCGIAYTFRRRELLARRDVVWDPNVPKAARFCTSHASGDLPTTLKVKSTVNESNYRHPVDQVWVL